MARTLLFIPGNKPLMIEKAPSLSADAIVLDLEDSVPPTEKHQAISIVRKMGKKIAADGCTVYIRVRGMNLGQTEEDIKGSVHEGLTGIVLAKTESAKGVKAVSRLLDQIEEERGIVEGTLSIIALIETARGLTKGLEIGRCPRVSSLAFGSVDYALDVGIAVSDDGHELLYARSHISTMASAAEVGAIDGPWVHLEDHAGLERDAWAARRLGFQGKIVVHPDQVEPVNRIFSQNEGELNWATKIVQAFEGGGTASSAVFQIDGEMVDLASYRKAKEILRQHEARQ